VLAHALTVVSKIDKLITQIYKGAQSDSCWHNIEQPLGIKSVIIN